MVICRVIMESKFGVLAKKLLTTISSLQLTVLSDISLRDIRLFLINDGWEGNNLEDCFMKYEDKSGVTLESGEVVPFLDATKGGRRLCGSVSFAKKNFHEDKEKLIGSYYEDSDEEDFATAKWQLEDDMLQKVRILTEIADLSFMSFDDVLEKIFVLRGK